ncbi:Hsp70 family protein [Frankia sp. R43]|uniref:Hsp70 family protein n=1 Tax=Frankia sp. R43 TaxID=269536 RepID=UPI0006CA0124|nr:Hsp70 family protein [Frankia sp. R43]
MSVVVGIDLGTTNSAVAIPADTAVANLDALIEQRRLRRVGDVLVITNPDRSPTTPSVVWVDEDGTVLVGMRAKAKARTSRRPPAMFFKRSMGTDSPIAAGYATLTPVEASAHVLRHLKALAEDVLGVPVERAVVTVPAFFETQAKIDTTEAGRLAGLEVVETLVEPVAAAMAYARENRSSLVEPRTFLVYDLGGGTFDTSVLRWDPAEGFETLAFDGDRYLGGYDFDRRIVSWMRDELPEYDLSTDPDDPASLAAYTSLLALAEEAKQELSRTGYAEIVSQHVTDRRGELMNLNLGLERGTFEAMIDAKLRQTLVSCDRSLAGARERVARAGGTLAALDDVVLVGGSARIPRVAELLAEHLGRPPRLLHPDLAVAIGAALRAAAVPRRGGILELDPPDASFSPTDVTGRIRAGGPVGDLAGGPVGGPAGLTVLLLSDDATFQLRTTSGPDGDFVFEDVPLRPGDNGFTIAVLDGGGADIGSQRLVIRYDEGQMTLDDTPPGDVLAHDFSIQLSGGLHPVALSGATLPYRASLRLETASQGTALRVQLFEGRVPIGEILVDDLPAKLPVGTPVEVILEFQAGWTIRAEASVPSVQSRVAALIDIPRREVPDWSRLRMDFEDVRTRWNSTRSELAQADANRAGTEIDDLLYDVAALLDEAQDQAQTHHRLLEAGTLVSTAAFGTDKPHLRPRLADFERDLALAGRQIARVDNPTTAQEFRAAVAKLEVEGRVAYEQDQAMAWAFANDALDQRIGALHRLTGYPELTVEQILDALQLEFLKVGHLLDVLPATAPAAEAARLRDQLTKASQRALAVALHRPDAASQLLQIYEDTVRPLQAAIRKLGMPVPEGTIFLNLRGGRTP